MAIICGIFIAGCWKKAVWHAFPFVAEVISGHFDEYLNIYEIELPVIS